MPYKSFEELLQKDNWFIYDKAQKNKSGETHNYYWYVYFPKELCLNNKSFNKAIYTIDDAIKWRNKMIYNYLQNNDKYKDILEIHLNKSTL